MVPSFDVTDVFLILPDKNVLTLADNMHFFNVIILHYGFLWKDLKRYADAASTISTNYPVIEMSVINCHVINCNQTR